MGEKDDILGLSLSLSLGGYGMVNPPPHLKVNHMQKPPQPAPMKHNKSSMNDLSQLPDRSSEMRSFLGGVDVNSAPKVTVAADCDTENGDASSPNSTVSSISGGKQSERDHNEAAAAGASCSRVSDDEDGGDAARKKLRLTKEQAKVLEETFKEYNTLTPKRKQGLAQELNLRPRQVEVWFQNRRARTKLKQTEVDCEYLKRCCENLTEENRRLQKEVQELRALKLSPHFSMHKNPPTTLTMCPSCERVAVSSASSSSATSQSAVVPSNRNLLDLSIRQPVPDKPRPFEGSIFRPY